MLPSGLASIFAAKALPILLSASYKHFVGGNIVATLGISDTFKFGMVGAPGMQNLGNGLSLMENSSMPFFQDPKLNNTYSFNMFSMTNKSTCFLDGPMPSSVQRMRSKLSQGGSLQFSANVTGTMAFDGEVPEKVRNISSLGIGDEDVRYGSVKINSNTSLMGIDFSLYPARFAFLFGQYNVTDLYVSKYSPDRNQTFGGQARRIKMERRQCSGNWRVTQSTVNLLAANCDSSSKGVGQGVLNNNFLAMQQFAFQMAEFITMPPSGKNGSNPDDVDLFVPATGAAVWSRITSLNGVEDGGSENLAIAYPRKLQNVKVDNSAMERNVLLFLILLLFPAATFVSIAVTAMVCSDTPISQNFGLLALMASSMPENREILRGASYSGKTNTVIGVDFFVEKDEHNLRQWISCAIREHRHSDRLTRGKMYD